MTLGRGRPGAGRASARNVGVGIADADVTDDGADKYTITPIAEGGATEPQSASKDSEAEGAKPSAN